MYWDIRDYLDTGFVLVGYLGSCRPFCSSSIASAYPADGFKLYVKSLESLDDHRIKVLSFFAYNDCLGGEVAGGAY